MSSRDLLRLGAGACLACCAGPFLGAMTGLGVLGAIGTLLFGAAALVTVGALVLAAVSLRWRAQHRPGTESTPVELRTPRSEAQRF